MILYSVVRLFRSTIAAICIAFPLQCFAMANHMDVGIISITPDATPGDMVLSLYATMYASIFAVATGVFVLGGFLYMTAADREEQKNRGKSFMIGALIGAGVVVGARILVNFVVEILYL